MYQGKFEAKNRPVRPAGEQVQESPRQVYRPHESAAEAARQQMPQARPGAGRPAGGQRPQQPYRDPRNPYPNTQRPMAPAQPQKRGPRLGGVIFYTLYFMLIAVVALGTVLGLNWLDGWLVDYEAAQPTVKCEQVFQQLFANPDWGNLYDLAGVADTQYEGKDAFVSYMTQKVGGESLTYVETSAGLATDGLQKKKYFVRLGEERVASFTLDGRQESVTDIPDWKLGTVELFFDRADGYKIQIADGHTAYVNGVALDDSYTIQITSTSAEEFLPIGTTGAKTRVQSITGLMMKPTVTVQDQTGAEMPVSYDEDLGMFVEQTESNTISDAEKQLVLGALRARGEFMINASGARAAVAKYYDSSSDAYKEIIEMGKELWMNTDRGHRFLSEEVTDYCKYSDELFSARGSIVMDITLKDGNTKQFDIDSTLFFRKKNGNWVCYAQTNKDVTKPVGKVRLTFVDESGTVLADDFFETNPSTLNTPVLSAPEGKVFSGWVKETIVGNRKELTVMFQPDENGVATIPSGTTLEPMTLRPLFEDAADTAE